ncbi:MAG TPA: DUF475 domain-containing protein [Anaerolineales bacterium]|nr:DUF475 domain-containing protein [Anaerolineales bacterium]
MTAPYGSAILIVLQLIFLEGILSIDNAAVLGAMVTPLPADQPVPWPRALRWIGKGLDPLLGHQRFAALRVGLLRAYLRRGAMLFITSFLIENPWVRIVGAAYLIHLAFNELGDATFGAKHDEGIHYKTKKNASFWTVVLTIELMDLVFSIDNVIAAVALSNEIWVVMLGVAIGILAMRFAAGWFSYAVERLPILKEAAYILILNIGVQLLLEQFWHIEISDWTRFAISLAIIAVALIYSRSPFLQKIAPVLRGISYLMGAINKGIDFLLLPIKLFFHWVSGGFRSVKLKDL